MILYHNSMSTCAQKVRFVLEEKSIAWESIHLNLRNGDQHTKEYLKLNPAGVVPTLVYEDEAIQESAVICEFLDDLVPSPRMCPENPTELARMRLWMKLIDDSIHAHAGVISSAIAFRFQKLEKGRESASKLVEKIPDEKKRERMRSIVFEGVESPLFEKSIKAFEELLLKMESALLKTKFLVGNELSIADVVCLPYIVRLEHLGMGGLWTQRPAITNWFFKLKDKHSFELAYANWEDSKYLELMANKRNEYWPLVQSKLN